MYTTFDPEVVWPGPRLPSSSPSLSMRVHAAGRSRGPAGAAGCLGSAPVQRPLPPTPAPRTVRIEAIVTDKHGSADRESPSRQTSPSPRTASHRRSIAPTWRSNIPPPVGPIAPAGEIKDDADEERAAREPGTRLIALYLDEYHVSAGENTERVRTAVSRFIDEQVRPNDLLVVMKPLDHLTEIRFTRDRAEARRVVGSFNGRRDDYTPRTPFEEQYLGRSPGAVRAARAQIVLVRAARAGDQDGRSQRRPRRHRADERRVHDRRAARARAAAARSAGPGARGEPVPRAVLRLRSGCRSPAVRPVPRRPTPIPTSNRHRCSRAWPARRAGDAASAGQDLGPAFQRVSSDLDSYYVLTFTSTNAERRPLPQPSGHVEPTRRAGAGALRLLGAASERAADDARQPARDPADAGAQAQPAHRLLVRSDRSSQTGSRRIIFTWTPATAPVATRTKPARRPDVVALKVTTPTGTVLFEGRSGPRIRGTRRAPAARQRGVPGDARTAAVRSDHSAGRRQQARRRARRISTCRTSEARRRSSCRRRCSAPHRHASFATSAPTPTPRRFPDASSGAPNACCCGSRRSSRVGHAVQVSAKLVNRVGVVLDRSGTDARRGRPHADSVRSTAGEVRARRVFDRSRRAERRRSRARADPLSNHRVIEWRRMLRSALRAL